MTIERFEGKYRFLSNFFPCYIEFTFDKGGKNETVFHCQFLENAYQARKTLDYHAALKIVCAPTPGEAKRLGKHVQLRPDWDSIKLQIMEELVRFKFSDPNLRSKLLNTGDEELIEGNYWNDTYWGKCRGIGQNNLGKILMKVRGELRG